MRYGDKINWPISHGFQTRQNEILVFFCSAISPRMLNISLSLVLLTQLLSVEFKQNEIFAFLLAFCYVRLNSKELPLCDFWYENASDERNETPKGNNRSIRTTLLTVSDLDETNRKSHHSININLSLIMVKIRSGSLEPIRLELRFRNPTLFIYLLYPWLSHWTLEKFSNFVMHFQQVKSFFSGFVGLYTF